MALLIGFLLAANEERAGAGAVPAAVEVLVPGGIGSRKQASLNINFANAKVFHGILPNLLQTKEAIMNRAEFPIPEAQKWLEENLAISQYRHDVKNYVDDPLTFLAYPVFDSFSADRQVAGKCGNFCQKQRNDLCVHCTMLDLPPERFAFPHTPNRSHLLFRVFPAHLPGVLATNIYWRLLFSNILQPSAGSYICVVENSYNQTFTFRLNGPDATYLGEGDTHEERYDYLEQFADINEYLQDRARPQTRSYTTVPLNKQFGQYSLRIYPTREMEEEILTNKPWVYTCVVLIVFVLTAVVLICLDRIVARRQRIVVARLVKSAQETAAFEHDLNAFLAHEVRNPIAAAMSAHGFVASAVDDALKKKPDDELMASLQEDVKIIGSSLFFIDDFLRSMLDIHASAANKLEIRLAPTDLLKDVLEPVRSVLYQRDSPVDVTVDCPENLVVMTDCLRLKQVN